MTRRIYSLLVYADTVVVLWSPGSSTISGWSPRAPSSSRSPTPWSNYRPRFRACRSGRSQIAALPERLRRLIGRAIPPRPTRGHSVCIRPSLHVVVVDDRRDIAPLNDAAVPANSPRRTFFPPCCADLHIGQLKRIQWMSSYHSCIKAPVLSSACRSIKHYRSFQCFLSPNDFLCLMQWCWSNSLTAPCPEKNEPIVL